MRQIQSPFFKGKVPVYHSISDGKESPLFASGVHDITVEQLEKQLTQLKRVHSFVFIDELSEAARKGKNIRKVVSITFDDGYRNFFTNALPVLEHLNIPATMFLSTKTLNGGVLWRDKIRLLMERGMVSEFLKYLKEELKIAHHVSPEDFYQKSKDPTLFRSSDVEAWLDDYLAYKELDPTCVFKEMYLHKDDIRQHPLVNFGNHTENHFMMSSLDKITQLKEITKAQVSLNNLNVPLSESFAIPFGNPNSYNDDTLEAASESGYKTILMARADRARGFVTKNSLFADNKALCGMRFLPGENDFYGK